MCSKNCNPPLFFFPHLEDYEDDGEEEEDKDSDSEDVKEEVGTLALDSDALHIHNSQRKVPFSMCSWTQSKF